MRHGRSCGAALTSRRDDGRVGRRARERTVAGLPGKSRIRREAVLRAAPGLSAGSLEPAWEREPDAGRDHRRPSGVDGLDDFVRVDALQVDGGHTKVRCPSWRWMTLSGTPSWASSIAWAWRS